MSQNSAANVRTTLIHILPSVQHNRTIKNFHLSTIPVQDNASIRHPKEIALKSSVDTHSHTMKSPYKIDPPLNLLNSQKNVSLWGTWKGDETALKPDTEQVMAMVEVAIAAPETAIVISVKSVPVDSPQPAARRLRLHHLQQ